LTDQRRNKAMPCSYVDQYAQLFNAEGSSASENKYLTPYTAYFDPDALGIYSGFSVIN